MSVCGRCGAAFGCAMADGAADGAPCWCTALPALLPVPSNAAGGCWCPACLRVEIERQQGASPTAPGAAQADGVSSSGDNVAARAPHRQDF